MENKKKKLAREILNRAFEHIKELGFLLAKPSYGGYKPIVPADIAVIPIKK